ncbi:MAG: glucokinase [Gemmatimonadetes bacterium]|nr:glucokinase [Gemmatimonadota bacterium]
MANRPVGTGPSGVGGETTGARVVADLGGTHARFATLTATGGLQDVEVMSCADFPRMEDAIRTYFGGHGIDDVAEICLAVAGPVDQDPVELPNNPWAFSRTQLEKELGARLTVINDFTAQALSIDRLDLDDLTWIGMPRPHDGGTRVVVGPGTGLGVAIHQHGSPVLNSEGGHVGFSPTSDHEIDLLKAMRTRFRRLSMERFLSGPGLENLYWANWQLERGHVDSGWSQITAREVATMAGRGDPVALRSVEDFFDILATFAGDLALTAWATGGVYMSGGVMRRLVALFDLQRFRARFEDKGRFTRFCETVPIAWIRFEYPGLMGCAAALEGRDGH